MNKSTESKKYFRPTAGLAKNLMSAMSAWKSSKVPLKLHKVKKNDQFSAAAQQMSDKLVHSFLVFSHQSLTDHIFHLICDKEPKKKPFLHNQTFLPC